MAVNNIAIGFATLYVNTSGHDNIACGQKALYTNTGSGNVAIGYYSLESNFGGNNNTAIGYESNVASSTFTNATAIGAYAKVAASNAIVLGATPNSNSTNVGIGTITPTNLLDIEGDSTKGVIRIVDSESRAAGKVLTSGCQRQRAVGKPHRRQRRRQCLET